MAAAETEDQLADRLRRQGQYLVRSTTASEGRASLAEIQLFERITRRDVVVFTQQLATVMATGVSLIEGLQDIESQLTKQKLKRVVAAVRRDIESGERAVHRAVASSRRSLAISTSTSSRRARRPARSIRRSTISSLSSNGRPS